MIRKLFTVGSGTPDRAFVTINGGLALFVIVAHGGALLLTFHQYVEREQTIRRVSSVSLPLACALVIASVVALINPRIEVPVLRFQSPVFVVGALVSVVWAAFIAVSGVPEGNFSWTPGVLTVFTAYAFYSFWRFNIPEAYSRYPWLKSANLVLLCTVGLIDGAVLVRTISGVFRVFRTFGS